MHADADWTVVKVAVTLIEADAAVSFLQAHGIHARIPDASSLGVASLTAMPAGFRVQVRNTEAEEAKLLLSESGNDWTAD